MPAVRNVGARVIAPACRHTVRWATYTNCGRRAFRLINRSCGEKCALTFHEDRLHHGGSRRDDLW